MLGALVIGPIHPIVARLGTAHDTTVDDTIAATGVAVVRSNYFK